MELLECKPVCSKDGQSVTFSLCTHGRDIECAVTRDALEQHFWLRRGAAEARIIRAFEDGRKRITAAAKRKALARGGERIVLTAADFVSG